MIAKNLKERFDEEDKKTWRTCTPNNYFSTETILRIVENWLTDKQVCMSEKDWSLSHALVFNELLEELR